MTPEADHGGPVVNLDEKWTRRFARLAMQIAGWSKDPSTRVGAVVFHERTHQIMTTGYNGLSRGVPDDMEKLQTDREYKLNATVHAEMNALIQAARYGPSLVGANLISTFSPCANCSSAIIQAGVSRVIAPDTPFPDRWRSSFDLGVELLRDGGVEYVQIPASWYYPEDMRVLTSLAHPQVTGNVAYSGEDDVWHGRIQGTPHLYSYEGRTYEDLVNAFETTANTFMEEETRK